MSSKINTAMAVIVTIVIALALIGAIIKGEAMQVLATAAIAFCAAMLLREVKRESV